MSRVSLLVAATLVTGLLAPPFVRSVVAQTAETPKPPAGVQQEFDAFFDRFRTALKSNDAAAVATMTKMPFFHEDAMIDAAQFQSKAYPVYFTKKARSCLRSGEAVYDRDGENNDNYFVFCGDSIFVFTRTPAGFLFSEVSAND
ncbi:MAG: hypothetical protein ACK50Q_11645 [Labrys sp. (in: a-proteobacteria)]|jgi:hypothetical protein